MLNTCTSRFLSFTYTRKHQESEVYFSKEPQSAFQNRQKPFCVLCPVVLYTQCILLNKKKDWFYQRLKSLEDVGGSGTVGVTSLSFKRPVLFTRYLADFFH